MTAHVHDLDGLMVEVKVRVPPLDRNTVSRARLVEQARSTGCRVVGVTAPAGYGKSTFLGEWARTEDRRVGWLSLDRFDDDPVVFLGLLASAYMTIDPDRGGLVEDVRSIGSLALSRAAPRLTAAFAASEAPFVLMLDDLHQLRSAACHDVLDVLIDGLPEGSQLVTASRCDQPHLARLRASGQLVQVGAADLALDIAGTLQVFDSHDVSLSPELASVLTRRTEGWPAGLHLAAMIAKDSPNYLGTVTGDDRYVADYLYRECLARQPEEVQQFLCATAVLGRLNGPLCDAVLGGSGGVEQLRQLEASSMFVVALDRRREWYRYHGLFREFLLSELRRRVSEAEIEKLHLKAADWYQANGSPTLAVEHLLETTYQDRSLQLVSSLYRQMYQAGDLATLRRWFGLLGDASIERYPPLAVNVAWGALLAGDTIAAERWAAFVDSASFELVPADGTASFASARAMLRAAMCTDGPETMMDDGAFAVAQEPVWGAYRDTAIWLLGEAHLLAGYLREADDLFAQASDAGARLRHPSSVVVGRSEMALLAMDRGDWQTAAEHLDWALTAMADNRLDDYLTSVLAYVAAARLALHRGDLTATQRELARAMRARAFATHAMPFVAVRLRVELAKLNVALAERSVARQLLREIDDILLRRPSLGVLVEQVNEVRSLLSSNPVTESGPLPLTSAELRLLPYMQTHLTLGAIAERLYVSRNTVSSQVTSIYRKLGVSSRREAVAEATTIGLLRG
jgi:LuxR family maltose regulon positive regulatory protein